MGEASERAEQPLPSVVVMDEQPGAFWFGAWGNINVLVWFCDPTLDAVKRLDRTNPERVRAHPEKLSTVHIITREAGPPPPDARAAFESMHNRYGDSVGCAAIVIERDGLYGAAVRGAITGMMLVAPKHYRVKVFDAVESAVPWLTTHHARSTGVQLPEAAVLSVLQRARRAEAGGQVL